MPANTKRTTRAKRGPQADQVARDEPTPPADPPIPTTYRWMWWPAMVATPERTFTTAKVFATAEGLYVYTSEPALHERGTGPHPQFFSPIRYDETPRPRSDYAARMKADVVITEAGRIRVQKLAGCGCNMRALKNWTPTWGTRIEPWSGA